MESESESNSNSSICEEEADRFVDAPDAFFYDCFPTHYDSHRLNSSPSSPERKPSRSLTDTAPFPTCTTSESFEMSSTVDELSFGKNKKEVDVIVSGNNPIDPLPEKEEDFEVIESCEDIVKIMDVTDSGRIRVDLFHETTLNDNRVDDNAGQESQLREVTSTNRSLLAASLAGRGRRFLLSRIVELCDLGLKDDKPVLEAVRRLACGLFWAVYVGVVLFALLVSAFLISGLLISHLAHEPLVVKESLNFDYTKNSPEAYVPFTSCDSSCKTEISVSMTLPESEYNRNLGMFQVRVDFLSESGQVLASVTRPCMVRFRSEPVRLVQTFLKIAPLVAGYVSEIQTLNLKLKGFVEKDIVQTACLKIVIEQRAEFRPGAGIPEIYDASLLLQSQLPFFARIIWNWRRTLFVWISMSLFVTELLFVLLFFRSLIIPTTQETDIQHLPSTITQI